MSQTLLTVEGRCWSVREELLPMLARLGESATLEFDPQLLAAAAAAEAANKPRTKSAVATVPLKGVLMPAMGGLFAFLFGGGGLDDFQKGLARAVADDDVKRIVLDIDSPGGLVDQIPETADAVWKARKVKPVTAVVNTLAASAAYWIASQADEIVISPSGEAGSIGVYAIHRDLSARYVDEGVKHTIVSAGRYKTEANPFEELDTDAREFMQQGVDDYYGMFLKAVARGRGSTPDTVRKGYGEGRTLTAKRAVAAGLADRIGTLSESQRARAAGSRPAARVPVLEAVAAAIGVEVTEVADDEIADDEPLLTVVVGGRELSVPATAENRRRIGSVPGLFAPGVNDELKEAADAG
jgi:signal peptide peptidase SppA